MKNLLLSVFVSALSVLGFGLVLGSPVAAHAATINAVIQGPNSSTLYWYASNGKRYVFPNANTYFTWFADFRNVQRVTTTDLAAIPLAGNVTYRPGAKLVKVESDPRVYAVSRYGVLRWVTSPSVAAQLYGNNWGAFVQDIPVTFFTNYTIGSPIYSIADYSVSNEFASVNNPSDNIGTGSTQNTTATTASLTASNNTVQAGQSFTLNASVLNPQSGANYTLRIYDQYNNLLQTCSANSCSVNTTLGSNETNNQRGFYSRATDQYGATFTSGSVTVFVTTTGTGTLSLSATPTSVSAGQTVTLHSSLNANTGNTVTVRYYDERDGRLVGSCSMVNADCYVYDSARTVSGLSQTYRYYALATDANGYNYPTAYSSYVTIGSGNTNGFNSGTTVTGAVTNRWSSSSSESIEFTGTVSNLNGTDTNNITVRIYDSGTGALLQTCTATTVCRLTLSSSTPVTRTLYARANDQYGYTVESSRTTVSYGTYYSSTTLTGSTNIYATPNPARIGNTISITASITGASVPASDLTTQIYNAMGGSAAQTCNGTTSCTLNTVAASAFSTNFYAVFTDRLGHTLTTSYLPVSAY